MGRRRGWVVPDAVIALYAPADDGRKNQRGRVVWSSRGRGYRALLGDQVIDELDGLMLGEVETLKPVLPEVVANWDDTKDQPLQANPPGTGQGPFGVGTTPGEVPARPENWDLSADPATYTIAYGDTFVGLAKTYLGNGAAWPHIWKYGHNAQLFPDPDVITSAGPLQMPPDAADNMRLWLKKGKPHTPPGKLQTKTSNGEGTTGDRKRVWPWLVGGALGGIGIAAIASR